VWNKQELPEE